jgi:diguanylate cyclase (GGDEF)-like protein/PAS domain S-box-containing protein
MGQTEPQAHPTAASGGAREASRALRERDAQLSTIFSVMTEGVVVQALDGRVLECNAAAERMLGLSRAQIEGTAQLPTGWRIAREDGDSFPAAAHPVASLLQAGLQGPGLVVGIEAGTGTRVWLDVCTAAVRVSPDEPPYALVGTFNDVTEQQESEERLRAGEAELRAYFESPVVGVAIARPDGGLLRVNAGLCAMLGYAREELARMSWCELVHPEDRSAATEPLAQMRAGRTSVEREQRYRRKDGTPVWALTSFSALREGPRGVTKLVAILYDISARRAAEARLAERELQLRAYFDSPGVGIIVLGADHRYLDANDRFCQMLGYSREELAGTTFLDLAHPEDRELNGKLLVEVLAGDRPSLSLENRYLRKDGSAVWALTSISGARGPDGRVEHVVGIIKDNALRKEAEEQLLQTLAENERLVAELNARTSELAAANEQLQQLNERDELTGIANRRKFDAHVEAEWRRATRFRLPVAVAMIDVDHFKAYNDLNGHQAGDECLKLVAQALSAVVRRVGELIARYGGEEFVAVLPGVTGAELLAFAHRLRTAVAGSRIPHPRNTAGPYVTVSVGAASVVPDAGSEPESLIALADSMLYQAKRNGRDRVELAG